MEGWLSNQMIPFERTSGTVGDPSDTCVKSNKTDPKQRCPGIVGLAKADVNIIDSCDATGLILGFKEDWFAESTTRLQESILAVQPNDWAVLRFNHRLGISLQIFNSWVSNEKSG